jgi:hypothetical protein
MLSRLVLGFVVATILVLTLTPAGSSPEAARFALEVTVFRGVADALTNILLFLPFGAAATVVFRDWRAGVLGALALSLGIETVQLWIPGRYTSPADVASNTLGGALGVLLVVGRHAWLSPAPAWRQWLSWAALAMALLVLVGGSRLFAPSFPDGVWFGQWAPDRSPLGPYPGRIIDARVGPMPVPWGLIREPGEMRRLLERGAVVRVTIDASDPPPSRMPLLTIVESQRLIFSIATDSVDLVLRYRMRATQLGLDQPELRWAGAMTDVRQGDRVELAAWRDGTTFCLSVDDVRRCGLGFVPADTWSLLQYPLPAPLMLIMPFVWTALLLVPAGFWSRGTGQLAAMAFAAAAVMLLAEPATGVRPTPPVHVAAAMGGLLAGRLLAMMLAALLTPGLPTPRPLDAPSRQP